MKHIESLPIRKLIASFGMLVCTLSTALSAAPWIGVDDVWLRSDIEMLSEINVIKTPVTTYPLMWASISRDIDSVKVDDIPEEYRLSYWNVKNALREAFNKRTKRSLHFKAANEVNPIRGFGEMRAEKAGITAGRSQMDGSLAWNINLNYNFDPIDGEEVRLDGSYLATVLGNWNLSIGQLDRWWGPTWGSATLVSNNARPLPAIMLQRNYSEPFETKWLSWAGPWTFNTFIGVLEDERVVTDAKLLGISVNFKPTDQLEFGLRRSAQWGGEGRDESISSFFDLLIGQDNCGSDGISCIDKTTEPGNQLAGIDFKWRPFTGSPMSVYITTIGEDEAGYLPAKRTNQFGVTDHFNIGDMRWRYFVEWSDTTVDGGRYDILYEHHIYRTGYRYHGLSIGSTYDNDSESVIVGFVGQLTTNQDLQLSIQQLKFNENAAEQLPRFQHSLTDEAFDTVLITANWRWDMAQNGLLNVNLKLNTDTQENNIYFNEQVIVGFDWQYPLQ